MKRIIILAATTGVLASCGGDGAGIGRSESKVWHMTASAEEKFAYFENQCLGFGFKKGTPEIAQCIQNQSNQSRSSANDRFSRAVERLQGPKTTHTDCDTFGSSIRCRSSTY